MKHFISKTPFVVALLSLFVLTITVSGCSSTAVPTGNTSGKAVQQKEISGLASAATDTTASNHLIDVTGF